MVLVYSQLIVSITVLSLSFKYTDYSTLGVKHWQCRGVVLLCSWEYMKWWAVALFNGPRNCTYCCKQYNSAHQCIQYEYSFMQYTHIYNTVHIYRTVLDCHSNVACINRGGMLPMFGAPWYSQMRPANLQYNCLMGTIEFTSQWGISILYGNSTKCFTRPNA